MEVFKNKPKSEPSEFDPFEDMFGVKMDVNSLLSIRELEDLWIELGYITEQDRHPVPAYLQQDWDEVVGPSEANRPHAVEI